MCDASIAFFNFSNYENPTGEDLETSLMFNLPNHIKGEYQIDKSLLLKRGTIISSRRNSGCAVERS